MSTNDGLSTGQTMGHRPIFVDPSSNCLCTTNPANGQVVWIVDPETGQPLTARQVYVDPVSGCLCSVDPATNKVAWIIDPATGRPMVGPQAQPAEPAPQQAAEVAQQPVEEPSAPATDELEQQPSAESSMPPVEEFMKQPADESWIPSADAPVMSVTGEPWAPAVQEPVQQSEESALPAISEVELPEPAVASQPAAVAEPAPAVASVAQPAAQVVDPLAQIRSQAPIQTQPQLEPQPQPQPQPQPEPQPEAQPQPQPPAQAKPEPKLKANPQGKPTKNPAGAKRRKPVSVMAVISLVLGVLGMIAAIAPLFVDVVWLIPGGNNPTTRLIVNNSAFGFAIIGLIFALIGTHGIQLGRKKGKTAAIIGVLLCVLSVVVVLMVQYLFPQAFSDAASKVTGTTGTPAAATQQSTAASSDTSTAASASSSSSSASSSASTDYSAMAIGDTVVLDNGLAVTVNSAQFNLENFDGAKVTMVNVTYKNEGSSTRSFNVYDWKALDASGALRSETYYSQATQELQSGDLAAGGSVTGNVYFEGSATKVFYYDNIVETESNIGWVLQ